MYSSTSRSRSAEHYQRKVRSELLKKRQSTRVPRVPPGTRILPGTRVSGSTKFPKPPSTRVPGSIKFPKPPSTRVPGSTKFPKPPSTRVPWSTKFPKPPSTRVPGSTKFPKPPSTRVPGSTKFPNPPKVLYSTCTLLSSSVVDIIIGLPQTPQSIDSHDYSRKTQENLQVAYEIARRNLREKSRQEIDSQSN